MMRRRNAASARAGSPGLADSALLIGTSSVSRRATRKGARRSTPAVSRPRLQRIDDSGADRFVELGVGAFRQSREHLVVSDRKDRLDDLAIGQVLFYRG